LIERCEVRDACGLFVFVQCFVAFNVVIVVDDGFHPKLNEFGTGVDTA
jgi:hypothetical protein